MWNVAGWTLVLGGMFIAAWSTYGFETAICYTREFRDPARSMTSALSTIGPPPTMRASAAATPEPSAMEGAIMALPGRFTKAPSMAGSPVS
jgi:hypothetical protein